MNTGIIASRYAKALLRFVQEMGSGEKVYAQACLLQKCMDEVKQLSDHVLKHSHVPLERKLLVLETALNGPMEPQLKRFVRLVDSNGRIEYFNVMLESFIRQYRAMAGIKVGRIVAASPSDELKAKVESLLSRMTSSRVLMDVRHDPEIIGGFVLEIDDMRLDASVKGQLQRIRKELVDNNNRLV